jgi:hypothetical protein
MGLCTHISLFVYPHYSVRVLVYTFPSHQSSLPNTFSGILCNHLACPLHTVQGAGPCVYTHLSSTYVQYGVQASVFPSHLALTSSTGFGSGIQISPVTNTGNGTWCTRLSCHLYGILYSHLTCLLHPALGMGPVYKPHLFPIPSTRYGTLCTHLTGPLN